MADAAAREGRFAAAAAGQLGFIQTDGLLGCMYLGFNTYRGSAPLFVKAPKVPKDLLRELIANYKRTGASTVCMTFNVPETRRTAPPAARGKNELHGNNGYGNRRAWEANAIAHRGND